MFSVSFCVKDACPLFPISSIPQTMTRIRCMITCHLLLMAVPLMAKDEATVTTNEFTLKLPSGWHQIDGPKAAFSAAPIDNNGRVFGIIVESAIGCPIPREIADESEYERAYWAKLDSDFETYGRYHITARDFRLVNGIPFRIVDAVRETAPENIYVEEASTPGNGNIYGLLSVKKGALPEDDTDLQALFQSFAFLQPPRLEWHQPFLHEFSNIVGTPIFLVVLGMGIYLLTIRKCSDIPQTRKFNICIVAMCLLSINGVWIAGLNSMIGMTSNLLLIGFFFLLRPLIQERKALIAQGKIVGPSPKRLKRNFWMLVGSALLGIAIFDVQFIHIGSIWYFVVVNILTIGTFALIFWNLRRNFFPKSDSEKQKKGTQ
jgi:hypothetical protein